MLPRARSLYAILAAAVISVSLAATVIAAPKRTGVLSAQSTTFAWDGGPGNGAGHGQPGWGSARCQPGVYECEDTLLDVKVGGRLTVDIKAGSGSDDLDLRLYKSDANGGGATPTDTPLVEDIREEKDARVERRVPAGFYVAQVAFYNATHGHYKGTATLVPDAPAGPDPQPGPQPGSPPPAQPGPAAPPQQTGQANKKKKKASCKSKAKKIKNAKKRKKAMKRCAKKKKPRRSARA